MKTIATLTLITATLIVSSLEAKAQGNLVPFFDDAPSSSRYQSPYSYSPVTPAYRSPIDRTPIDNRTNYRAPSYRAPSYRAPSYRAPSYRAPNYGAPSYVTPDYRMPNDFAPGFPTDRPSRPVMRYPSYIRPVSTYPPQGTCPNGACGSCGNGNCANCLNGNCLNGNCDTCLNGSCNTDRGVYPPRPTCPGGRCEPPRVPMTGRGYRVPAVAVSGYRPASQPVYARPVSIFRD